MRRGCPPALRRGAAPDPARFAGEPPRQPAARWPGRSPAWWGSSDTAAPWRCRPHGRCAPSTARRTSGGRTARRRARAADRGARPPACACRRASARRPLVGGGGLVRGEEALDADLLEQGVLWCAECRDGGEVAQREAVLLEVD